MKILMGGLVGLVLAGAITVHAATPSATSRAQSQIKAVLQAWTKAEMKRDAGTLRRILSPRFIATYDAGTPRDRDAFIHAIVDGRARMTAQSLSETTVVIDRDTAVAAGLDTIHWQARGEKHTTVYRYTVTFVHRDGRWQALAEHIVPVQSPRK